MLNLKSYQRIRSIQGKVFTLPSINMHFIRAGWFHGRFKVPTVALFFCCYIPSQSSVWWHFVSNSWYGLEERNENRHFKLPLVNQSVVDNWILVMLCYTPWIDTSFLFVSCKLISTILIFERESEKKNRKCHQARKTS